MSKFDTHGGYFAPKDYLRVNEGGSHEENPNGGVQVGVDPEGTPNLLEEGEPVYKDYVYSDNIEADEKFLEDNNLPKKYAGKLYSKIADDLFSEAEERPLDPISRNGLDVLLGRLADAQEGQKSAKEQAELEAELAQLSPEELDALEQMLAEQEQAQMQPEVPQEQMMGPAEQIPQEQMMPQGMMQAMPGMRCGGKLHGNGGNLFGFGGPDRKSDKQRDEVLAAVIANANASEPRASGMNNTDLPLVTEHPELDLALMAAQPGSIATKLMAPSVYRGMINGIANGEDPVELFMPFPLFGRVAKTVAEIKREEAIAKALGLEPKGVVFDNIVRAEELEKSIKELNTKKASLRGAQKQVVEKEISDLTDSMNASIENARKHAKSSFRKSTGTTTSTGTTNAAPEAREQPVNQTTEETVKKKGNFWKGAAISTGVATGIGGLYKAGEWMFNSGKDIKEHKDPSFYAYPTKVDSTGATIVAPDTIKIDSGIDLGFLDEEPEYKARGGKINRGNRFDGGGWADFLNLVRGYTPSSNAGGIAGTYSIDPNFNYLRGYKDIYALENSDPYIAFTNYVKTHSDDPNVRAYLKLLDQNTGGTADKLFLDDNRLRDNWFSLYEGRRGDHVAGIYHLNPEDIGFLTASAAPVATAQEPQGDTGYWMPGGAWRGVREYSTTQKAPLPWQLRGFNPQMPDLRTGVMYDVKQGNGLPENASLGLPEFTLNNPFERKFDPMNPLGRDKTNMETTVDGVVVSHPNPYASSATSVNSGSGSAGRSSGTGYGAGLLPTWPRYAGAVGAGLLGLYNTFQQPDRYRLQHINPQLPEGRIHLQNAVYNPVDQNMVANAMIAQGNATNRALRNSGLGPSAGAAILASDNNVTGNLGTGFLQTWDANNQRRNAVIAANNQAEAQRANFDYTVDAARKQILNNAAYHNLQNDLMLQRLNYGAEGDKYTAISNQIANGLQALSGIGQENFAMNQINTNPAFLGYRVAPNGRQYYNPYTKILEDIKTKS